MLFVAVAAALWPAGAYADTVTVTSLGDSGSGTLRQAMTDAPSGSTIIVPAGTITLTTGTIFTTKTLTIDGAGTTSTVISGGGTGGVFEVGGTGSVLTLSQLTVRDGHLTDPSGTARGAGLAVASGASGDVDHVLFTNNVADTSSTTSFGGQSNGGAIANLGTLTVTDSSIVGNRVISDAGPGNSGESALGAGIYSSGPGNLVVERSNISGNKAEALGGGGPPSANNRGGSIQGAGIYFSPSGSANATIRDTTVSGNSGDASDGPGATDSGSVQGAGVFARLDTQNMDLTNVTIAGNSAAANGLFGVDEGGGLFAGSTSTGLTTVTNSTIARNVLTLDHFTVGGNVFAGTGVRLLSTIISEGVSAPGSENCSGSPSSLGHNIEDMNQCGFGAAGDQPNTNPKLGPLQDNGGPAPTLAIGTDSPAFNGGDPATCPATDERGVARPQGAGCDAGAFELELADLGLRASASTTRLNLGQTVTFTLSASNGGSGSGHGTAISAQLPAGLALVSSSGCSGAGTLSCGLGEVGPGATPGVQIVALATKSGVQAMNAGIGSSTVDPSAGNNAAGASVTVNKLRMRKAGLSRRKFRLGSLLPKLSKVRTGTTIRFTLPEASRVKLAFARKRGRRFRAAGSFSVRAHAGLNKLRFQGRLTRRKVLRPGRYRVTLRATDQFGNRSQAPKLGFTLLPRG